MDVAGGSKPPPGALSKHIAAAIRAEIGRAGMPRRELADLIGVSPRQFDRYLNAERTIDIEQFAAICEALNLDPADVLRAAASE